MTNYFFAACRVGSARRATETRLDPHGATPAELQERIAAERAQEAFVRWREGDGRQRILSLGHPVERVTVGRAAGQRPVAGRALFAKFGIADLAQNQKRARLVELAMRRGHVSRRDLAS